MTNHFSPLKPSSRSPSANHGRSDEATKIIELMSEAATRSLLQISVHETINVSNIGLGHVAEFEFDDHREALRFIVLWGRATALRLAGKDKHDKLIYHVIPYRDKTYGFVGQLDEVEAFVDAQRENHRRGCAYCAALHHGSTETPSSMLDKVVPPANDLKTSAVEIDQ